MQSPTTMRSPGDEPRAAAPRGCESDASRAFPAVAPGGAALWGAAPGGTTSGAAAAPCSRPWPEPPFLAPYGSGGSACTAVGAELREPAGGAGWVCEPPGFIAAESSQKGAPVETNCA